MLWFLLFFSLIHSYPLRLLKAREPSTLSSYGTKQDPESVMNLFRKKLINSSQKLLSLSTLLASSSYIISYKPILDFTANLSEDSLNLQRITSVVYLDVKISNYTEESVGKNLPARGSGRLVIGLYGNDAPESVKLFTSVVESDGERFPSFFNAQLGRIIDGTYIQMDPIPRLEAFKIAGYEQFQYNGEVLTTLKPILESNALRHNR
jgi:hypothetical protein